MKQSVLCFFVVLAVAAAETAPRQEAQEVGVPAAVVPTVGNVQSAQGVQAQTSQDVKIEPTTAVVADGQVRDKRGLGLGLGLLKVGLAKKVIFGGGLGGGYYGGGGYGGYYGGGYPVHYHRHYAPVPVHHHHNYYESYPVYNDYGYGGGYSYGGGYYGSW